MACCSVTFQADMQILIEYFIYGGAEERGIKCRDKMNGYYVRTCILFLFLPGGQLRAEVKWRLLPFLQTVPDLAF